MSFHAPVYLTSPHTGPTYADYPPTGKNYSNLRGKSEGKQHRGNGFSQTSGKLLGHQMYRFISVPTTYCVKSDPYNMMTFTRDVLTHSP